MKKTVLTLMLLASAVCSSAENVRAVSPDGHYVMTLDDASGIVTYTLSYDGKTVVLPSQLGIDSGCKWLEGLTIGSVKTGSSNTKWRPPYGERSEIRDHYKSYGITLEAEGGRRSIVLEVRAYNEGIAFRYCFTGGSNLRVTDEYTQYSMPEGTMAFYTQRAQTPHEILPLRDWPADGQSDRPLLLKLPDKSYVCLAEAGVVDYVRTKFRLAGKPSTIETAMFGPFEGKAPYKTPWRVIMYGEKAGDILAHNSIFYNLNDPCAINDISWIRPGKVMREVTLTTKGGKDLVDFAVRRNLQYIHFDAGWYGPEYDMASDATTVTLDPARNPVPDALDLQEVIAYAKSKGIGVFLYVNQRALQQRLDELLPLYRQWGVAGIKFGFVHVGSQEWTAWLHEAVKKCASYGLMVDIHDEYRPTGVSRTYPNLMTQEGVRGNEEFPDGFNNTVLPFTRFVAGPADYTVCYYKRERMKTTPAHQLAISVVYYSPLQYMYWYDRPSDCQDEPELKFFDDVYTVWDDTRVLEGEPGQYATIARRHGKEWFVGTICNDARKVSLDLSFLPKGKFLAEIYADGDDSIPTRTHVRCTEAVVTRKSTLPFDLRSNGGAAVRLVPVSR